MDDGTVIAGGFRFVIWSILGDQEHFCNYLKLPHWCTLYSCWECTLTGPEQMESLGTSIKSNNMRTVDQEMNCRISSHALFTLPGVSHFLNIAQDATRILFCKGVFSHAMGNALKHWVYHCKFPGHNTQRERLTYIWNKIRDAYKLYGTENKLATLKASMFTSTDKPHQEKPFLRTKAGECKSLVPVFATLAIELPLW